MKILFTSVGRRVELVQAFRDASNRMDIPLEIFGADMTDSAPALCFCDRTVLVPRIRQPDYIPTLLQVCEQERIDLLIPTIDTDLLILAEHRAAFEPVGTKVVISAPEKVALCRDKRYTARYFQSVGLFSPDPVDDVGGYCGGFPAFIKPRDGSSSVNAYKVRDERELAEYAARVPDYIVQPFVDGVEYTVDVFCDFFGNPIYITPRERMAVRAGEVLKTRICQDDTIISEIKALVADYRPCGPITVQLIKDRTTGANWYIEINPRFGGGAPLSMKAGADAAEAMLRLVRGEKLDFCPHAAADGAIYSRFDQSVCTTPGEASEKKSVREIEAVIFDLDDTLYSEKEYVRNGFAAAAQQMQMILDGAQKLWNAFQRGLPAIDTVLHQAGIVDEAVKRDCLAAYRSQALPLHLYDGAGELIEQLRKKNIKVGIITDGRPEGQWTKLRLLGLPEMVDEIIVTDELGGPQFRKPNDIAFRLMQGRLGVPYEQMVYVGDNPQKDFAGPDSLGMQTVYFCNPDGLYSRSSREARISVSSFEDLCHLLDQVAGK